MSDVFQNMSDLFQNMPDLFFATCRAVVSPGAGNEKRSVRKRVTSPFPHAVCIGVVAVSRQGGKRPRKKPRRETFRKSSGA